MVFIPRSRDLGERREIDTEGVFTPKNQEYASISISHIFLCAWQINTCLILP